MTTGYILEMMKSHIHDWMGRGQRDHQSFASHRLGTAHVLFSNHIGSHQKGQNLSTLHWHRTRMIELSNGKHKITNQMQIPRPSWQWHYIANQQSHVGTISQVVEC
jgi:hypothetical protein